MKKIYIYKAEILKKGLEKGDNIVNLVKLTRPSGLEEHWPKKGDIVNIFLNDDIFYTTCKIVGKTKDLYFINETSFISSCSFNVDVNNEIKLLYKSLLNEILEEIKDFSNLSINECDTTKCLSFYLSFNMDANKEFFEKSNIKIKDVLKRTIIDAIKNIDVCIDYSKQVDVELKSTELLVEEIIETEGKDGKLVYKGIKEEEQILYRLFVKTNIFKK